MSLPSWFEAKVSVGDILAVLTLIGGVLIGLGAYRFRRYHALAVSVDSKPIRRTATFAITAKQGTTTDRLSVLRQEKRWSFVPFAWQTVDLVVLGCQPHMKMGKAIAPPQITRDGGRTFLIFAEAVKFYADSPLYFDITIEPPIKDWSGRLSFGIEVELGRGITKGYGRVNVVLAASSSHD